MRRGIHGAAFALAAVTFVSARATAAPALPSGPHPRLFLSPTVLTAFDDKSKDPSSAAARLIKTCDDVIAAPSDWSSSDNFGWGVGATSCGAAWQLTKKPDYATAGLKMLTALLNDKTTLGDGAGGDTVVQHDDGYFIRDFGPYSAIAYDWLHDAPGMDAVRPQAIERFKAWLDWYAASGYLKDQPGANYHAGYVFAKTTISIAMAGDDPAAGDYFTDVADNLFKAQIIGVALAPGGVLTGGDWAEGWQYGPLSVLEYALSARALAEQGVSFPEIATWSNDLALRFFHGLTPTRSETYVGGDYDNAGFNAAPNAREILASLIGPSSDQAAGWAAFGRKSVAKDRERLVFVDALAEARNAAPVDPAAQGASKWYVAAGTRRLYARSSFEPTASWIAFVSSPHHVPDHEHADASNVVFYRGGDALLVDPSPYGSLSTITSNALTVESNVVGDDYRPSQAVWPNKSELPWARSGQSGIVAARADLANAFVSSKAGSDVPYAHRELAFLPEGDLVLVDRARTDDPSRGMRVRFHAPSAFTLSGNHASVDVNGSTLHVFGVELGGQTPVQRMSSVGDCYGSNTRGNCENARFAAGQYDVRVPGPSSLAVHVLSGVAKGEAPPTALSLNDPSVAPDKNADVVGAVVQRGPVRTLVVASSGRDGATSGTLSYRAPAGGGARNVVFDAPEASDGSSAVTATKDGDGCRVSITAGAPGQGFVGRPLMFTLGSADDPCAVLEDKFAPPGAAPLGNGGPGGPNAGAGASDDSASSGGCGCRTAGRAYAGDSEIAAFGALAAVVAVTRARRRRKSRVTK